MASSIETTDTTTTLKNNGNTYLSVDTNDVVALANPLPIASGGTGSDDGAIYLQTAVAATSGATKDFTGIPAGVKRVTLNLTGVSTTGNSPVVVQIGPSGGVETSGYLGCNFCSAASGFGNAAHTAYFSLTQTADGGNLASSVRNGSLTFNLLEASSNTWTVTGIISHSDVDANVFTSGSKPLAGALSIVRLTTAGGSHTFDAGKVSVSWEF